MTTHQHRDQQRSRHVHTPPPLRHPLLTPEALSFGTLAVAVVAGGLTLALPDVLAGPAAMRGSARGTAAVLLLAAVPALAVGMVSALRGSAPGLLVWAGSLAYVLYNAVMFCFATPFNPLFLAYVALLGFSFWSLVALFATPFGGGLTVPERVARPVAAFIWVVVALNTAAWLATIVPATLADDPRAFLDGTGLTTNPVFVQDLAVWLPALAVSALMLWQGRAWGAFTAGAGLVFWTLEALGVAADQWAGHRADPTSDVVSAAVVPLFLLLAAITLVPLVAHLRALRHT